MRTACSQSCYGLQVGYLNPDLIRNDLKCYLRMPLMYRDIKAMEYFGIISDMNNSKVFKIGLRVPLCMVLGLCLWENSSITFFFFFITGGYGGQNWGQGYGGYNQGYGGYGQGSFSFWILSILLVLADIELFPILIFKISHTDTNFKQYLAFFLGAILL